MWLTISKPCFGISGKELDSWLEKLKEVEAIEKLISEDGKIPIDNETDRNKAMLAVIDTVAY